MILTEEGYITLAGTTPTYYFYIKDHQGNNRVVINQSGAVQQANHYYPFGGMFGEGVQTVNQPYKYNGKEIDRFQDLDMYDYSNTNYHKKRVLICDDEDNRVSKIIEHLPHTIKPK